MLIGAVSYALFIKTQEQSDVNSISTISCLSLTIENVSEYIEEDYTIKLDNAYPVEDAEGLKQEPYKFKVTNNCEYMNILEINLETLEVNNPLSREYVKASIDGYDGVLVSRGEEREVTVEGANNSNNIYTTLINGKETREFELRLWIDESASIEEMGKTYLSKVVINGIAEPEINNPSPKYWNEAADGTLLAAIRTNNPKATIIGNELTKPGVEVSTTDEGLRATVDDYGVSYYYRGAVENNYVVFAGMCWRIVRITGDGSIKLVLYNYNPNELDNPCNETGSDLAFARYDNSENGQKGASNFRDGDKIYQNAGAGYMYGVPGSNIYLEEHANVNDSVILTNLKKWYDKIFIISAIKNNLADVIWCSDKSVLTDNSYNPLNLSNVKNTGVNRDITYYSATKRLIVPDEATPSLKCGKTKNNNKLSKYTSLDINYGNGALNGYKIGLLTADEIAYAGAIYNSENSSYYLIKNANISYWWTLTPSHFNNINTFTFDVRPNGTFGGSANGVIYRLRPSIALIPSVTLNSTIINQEGTAAHPFVINEG